MRGRRPFKTIGYGRYRCTLAFNLCIFAFGACTLTFDMCPFNLPLASRFLVDNSLEIMIRQIILSFIVVTFLPVILMDFPSVIPIGEMQEWPPEEQELFFGEGSTPKMTLGRYKKSKKLLRPSKLQQLAGSDTR
ncbi:hypothetical protein MA16_Dca001885 [Dendrobium catenatum]|uniref:Uncharacterized protein n=1 Tax=Dendrobium catenatum TaxID=906689 RepID=A0A2I0XDT1_9ASPA|nr:hypothetical protein MA16_Dca001885 [Dendrobium catenatum]